VPALSPIGLSEWLLLLPSPRLIDAYSFNVSSTASVGIAEQTSRSQIFGLSGGQILYFVTVAYLFYYDSVNLPVVWMIGRLRVFFGPPALPRSASRYPSFKG
jgi:hypothetical protein